MAGRRLYDLMYRLGLARAFWSRVDRWEIRGLVEGGRCDPGRLAPPSGGRPRALDLGCGEGGVAGAGERHHVAALIGSLARPGSRFFLYTFFARHRDLPWFSVSGPSRLAPERLEPGEVEALFGDGWDVERIPREAVASSPRSC